MDEELKKYQTFHTRLVGLTTTKDNFCTEKANLKKAINDFKTANDAKIKEIEEENLKIATNQRYANSYKKYNYSANFMFIGSFTQKNWATCR